MELIPTLCSTKNSPCKIPPTIHSQYSKHLTTTLFHTLLLLPSCSTTPPVPVSSHCFLRNKPTHTHTHTHTHTEDDIILPQGEASNLNRSDTDVKPMSPFIARSHSCQQWLPSGRVRTACTLGSQGSKSRSYQATYSVRTPSEALTQSK